MPVLPWTMLPLMWTLPTLASAAVAFFSHASVGVPGATAVTGVVAVVGAPLEDRGGRGTGGRSDACPGPARTGPGPGSDSDERSGARPIAPIATTGVREEFEKERSASRHKA